MVPWAEWNRVPLGMGVRATTVTCCSKRRATVGEEQPDRGRDWSISSSGINTWLSMSFELAKLLLLLLLSISVGACSLGQDQEATERRENEKRMGWWDLDDDDGSFMMHWPSRLQATAPTPTPESATAPQWSRHRARSRCVWCSTTISFCNSVESMHYFICLMNMKIRRMIWVGVDFRSVRWPLAIGRAIGRWLQRQVCVESPSSSSSKGRGWSICCRVSLCFVCGRRVMISQESFSLINSL